MPTPKSNELRTQQYERRKQICEWLAAHKGKQKAVDISRGIGVIVENIRNPIEWLVRHELLVVESQVNPRKVSFYQLAMPINDVLMELADEFQDRENNASNKRWLDQEHLDWMTKYRKKFVERRQAMKIMVPDFATEC